MQPSHAQQARLARVLADPLLVHGQHHARRRRSCAAFALLACGGRQRSRHRRRLAVRARRGHQAQHKVARADRQLADQQANLRNAEASQPATLTEVCVAAPLRAARARLVRHAPLQQVVEVRRHVRLLHQHAARRHLATARRLPAPRSRAAAATLHHAGRSNHDVLTHRFRLLLRSREGVGARAKKRRRARLPTHYAQRSVRPGQLA
jgi:hypothetical protein